MRAPVHAPSRRRLLKLAAAALLPVGCGREPPLLRLGANPWLGCEPLFLARDRGQLAPERIRLVALPSNTDVLLALGAARLEVAVLTLDETLSARSGGIPLQIVAVLDRSVGADVLLARPGIDTLPQLAGRRIGVKKTAIGALLLHAALRAGGLEIDDVQVVHLNYDAHLPAFRRGEIDAVVTFEPRASVFEHEGAQRLFDSADTPVPLMDVLVVREDRDRRLDAPLRRTIAAHLDTVALLQRQPDTTLVQMQVRQRLSLPELKRAFAGVAYPDLAGQHAWLSGHPARIETQAAQLAEHMLEIGLLARPVPLAHLVDDHLLPTAAERAP